MLDLIVGELVTRVNHYTMKLCIVVPWKRTDVAQSPERYSSYWCIHFHLLRSIVAINSNILVTKNTVSYLNQAHLQL